MVFVCACIQQVLMKECEQQEGLAAAPDAGDYFDEVSMFPTYQLV